MYIFLNCQLGLFLNFECSNIKFNNIKFKINYSKFVLLFRKRI